MCLHNSSSVFVDKVAVISRILDSPISYIGLLSTVIPYKVTQIGFVSRMIFFFTLLLLQLYVTKLAFMVIFSRKFD